MHSRRRFLFGSSLACLAWQAGRAEPATQEIGAKGDVGVKLRPLPTYRIAAEGWGRASVTDIKAVLDSAASELWKYFPNRKLEPFVVMRGDNGPIVHFKRNLKGEIVMKLDTQDTFWSQYSYQFAHEFCHILAGFDLDYPGNLWFEETLCELASLFVMRHMAETWKKTPPYPNWKNYSSALEKYVGDVLEKREKIPPDGLPDYYKKHAEVLRSNPTDRDKNGAMAAVLLELFERNPEGWESVAYLNSAPSPEGETFQEYLAKWLRAAPNARKAFIASVIAKFGIKV